ncbi:hypothetical protein TEK04_15825 [Klenkia sp. LSe6-5]|uniref:Abi-like protein n=1 Tax=Klenkia sesuvii TaxID=3103137 RepID=A0ABU8DWX2_9ACTN
MSSPQPSPAQAETWFSRYRYRHYLNAANGHHGTAIDLYHWNTEVSGAWMEVFAALEVVLRNAVDATLTQLEVPATARMRPHDGWWFGDSTILTEKGLAVFRATRDRLRVPEQGDRDKVLAQLSFGFWSGLFGPEYDELFRHHLKNTFSARPDKGFERKSVSSRLEDLRKLRNSVAHHQPVHRQPLAELHEQALELIGWIDPDAQAWTESWSRVPDLLSRQPGPVPPLAVVVPAAEAWPLYQTVAAYVCQPGRYFQPVSHVAFYAGGAIQPQVAKIVDRMDHVPWTPQEISRLRATRHPRDLRLAHVIKAARSAGWTGDQYQVFLLTSDSDPPGSGHVSLASQVEHGRRGRGSAYVQRQRYVAVDALEQATTTSDLPAWR